MDNTPSPALRQLFADLGSQRLFVVYAVVPNDKGGTDKIPFDPSTGHNIDAQKEANRMPADEAQAWVSAGIGAGVGLVVTEASGLFFLDIDHCRQGQSWAPYAVNFLQRFPGCYVECSQSGEGLHVLGRRGPVAEHRTRNKEYRLEFYTRARFCALTGIGAYGSILTDATPAVEAFIDTFMPTGVNDEVAPDWTTEPCEDWRGPADDGELIRRAVASKGVNAVFGNGLSFSDFWYGTPAFEDKYAHDRSGGDVALSNHLAFWTGSDCERMLRLMKQAGIARDKWERPDYLPRTILNSCASQKAWYSETVAPVAVDAGTTSGATDTPASVAPTLPAPVAPANASAPGPVVLSLPVPGSLASDSLPYPDLVTAVNSLLARFVYLRSENKYYERATRVLIGPEALNKSEASRMPRKDDGSGGRHKACDVFDLCPTKVECVGEGYAPGYEDIYTEPGGVAKLVNTYRAPTYERLEPTTGERDLFTQYLLHLFPNGSEWLNTYLDGLAYLLANPRGRLAYMTVLTGAKKGTGKSILMQTIPRLLFGIMNVSSPDAKASESNFSDYLHHKRIVCFDELFAGDDREEAEARMNARSAWITDDYSLPVHPKGKKAYESRPNVVTFFGTSNYPTKALFLPEDDRRYALEETHAAELPEYLKEHFASEFLISARAAGVLAWIISERDASKFNPRKRPAQNVARTKAQQASLTPLQQELAAMWNEGEFYRDFDTVANLRNMLARRGFRHCPADFKLSQELQGVMATLNQPCIKLNARVMIEGAYSRVWVWRNINQWATATAQTMADAYPLFKMGE